MLDPRLNHVVAVARAGSFTAAAAVVGVTQSAITKSIADLERQIGYSIFHRTARGALLTEDGRDFVERTARLLDDAGKLLRRSRSPEDAYAGVLRIGVCPASLEWRLTEPLDRLLRRHPTIRVDASGGTFERMVQQLRNGAVDVAVGLDAAFSVWSDLRRDQLGTGEVALFVRRGHPLLERETIAMSDLAEFAFVSPSDSRPYGEVIRNIYESQGIDWRERLHIVDFFPTVQRIVATSDAIGVVELAMGRSSQFQKRFTTLEHLKPFSDAPLCCATRTAWERSPAARAFIAACIESMPPMKQKNMPATE